MRSLSNKLYERICAMPLLGPIMGHRLVKFGTVGLSGTFVNLLFLTLNQEVFLKNVMPPERRLQLSLSIAIFFATLNNYLWNRTWTWRDRKGRTTYGFFIQMGQYFLACSLAIILQYVLTLIFSTLTHYMIANVAAIILAAIFVYIVNDIWTFAVKRL